MTKDNESDTSNLESIFSFSSYEEIQQLKEITDAHPVNIPESSSSLSIDFDPLEAIEKMDQLDLSEEHKLALNVSTAKKPAYLDTGDEESNHTNPTIHNEPDML